MSDEPIEERIITLQMCLNVINDVELGEYIKYVGFNELIQMLDSQK
jgi:hypothetical protein